MFGKSWKNPLRKYSWWQSESGKPPKEGTRRGFHSSWFKVCPETIPAKLIKVDPTSCNETYWPEISHTFHEKIAKLKKHICPRVPQRNLESQIKEGSMEFVMPPAPTYQHLPATHFNIFFFAKDPFFETTEKNPVFRSLPCFPPGAFSV